MAEQNYFKSRVEEITKAKATGFNPYPHKFHVSLSIPKIKSQYGQLKSGSKEKESVTTAGRIRRTHLDKDTWTCIVENGGEEVQIVSHAGQYEGGETAFQKDHALVKKGDIIGVKGFPASNADGVLTLEATHIVLLSPCYHQIPEEGSFQDLKTRYSQRYLDLLVNVKNRKIFINKARTISYIRAFLDDLGFVEVETPVLTPTAGGAHARPFITHHNDLGIDLAMRTSTELFLKQLIVGGFEKVYEVGRNFRNERTDAKHNPEFTAVELCQAYVSHNELTTMAEKLISAIVKEITGGSKIKHTTKDGVSEIDFSTPFDQVFLIPELEKKTGSTLTSLQWDSDETHKLLLEVAKKHNVTVSSPASTAQVLDKLVSELIEPHIVKPTFILGYPDVMSPLAKGFSDKKGLTERFELVIGGIEVLNGYTDLNDPREQKKRYDQQSILKAQGDEGAQTFNETFCVALEYALPPTSGLGIGVDRLVMVLSDLSDIKEAILFPAHH
eukprot:TRINITY_DN770_c0_g1_i1.p1 TRINITY_DN770_c0_g1~~TRINITY_DN770_c0_g1_i1.p1  ORF type:complete len:499 (+),score=94.25 TRINITY_DN770_c0_g1_i1:72-1568(+)